MVSPYLSCHLTLISHYIQQNLNVKSQRCCFCQLLCSNQYVGNVNEYMNLPAILIPFHHRTNKVFLSETAYMSTTRRNKIEYVGSCAENSSTPIVSSKILRGTLFLESDLVSSIEVRLNLLLIHSVYHAYHYDSCTAVSTIFLKYCTCHHCFTEKNKNESPEMSLASGAATKNPKFNTEIERQNRVSSRFSDSANKKTDVSTNGFIDFLVI